jgi:hypothetical protein
LYAKAAWLAIAEEYEKCIETLDMITKRDPLYPGVWILKAKIYSQLGNEEMARLCLERGGEQSESIITFDSKKKGTDVPEDGR